MTDGGPYGSSRVLSFYMYEQALSEYGYRMGYGAAIAVILFAIMMVFISGFIWKMVRDERGGMTCFHDPSNTRRRRDPDSYKVALPIALILWLLPLLGVAMTSLKPSSDLAAGNYFGLPSQIAFWNYADVFTILRSGNTSSTRSR
jgi:ABC-type Fe3+ transport system permease subunit